LGYAPAGGRVSLRLDETKRRLLVGGQRADEIASLLAFAAREEDLRVLVLDLDGHISERVAGYLAPYDYTYFLYDAFELEPDEEARHSRLIAAAYTTAMDLDAEEEAILDSAMQHLASEDQLANPPVVFNALDKVEGFRGFYVQKLQGRFGALKHLLTAQNGSFSNLLAFSGAVISFRNALYPQAVEVAASIYLAKLLVAMRKSTAKPDMVIINDAHRIFRGVPRLRHANRLFTELMDLPVNVVLASDQMHALNPLVLDAFHVKVFSSDEWNRIAPQRRNAGAVEPILPSSFVIENNLFGHRKTFIARGFEHRGSEAITGALQETESLDEPDPKIMGLVLEEVAMYAAPTRLSLIEFLSGGYGEDTIKRQLDLLQAHGYIRLEKKEVRRGGEAMLAYGLTEKGVRQLEALRRK
jgi:hypothetical protein